MPWPAPVRVAVTAVGAGAGAAVATLASGALPRPRTVAVTLGVTGVLAGAGAAAGRRVLAGMLEQGRTIDAALRGTPTDPHVSGGPGSAVDFATVGREGARFLTSRVSAGQIAQVLGASSAREPVRVFVGADCGPTPEARVALALAELRRTGALDRSVLVVQAPAGTGYANTTPIQAVEILTAGDCATVAVGYGLLPSFLSLGKVPIAALTQRLLLEGIRRECAGSSVRPRLLLYGESLGARVQQAALLDLDADLDAFGVDAALWVGTPGGRASDALHASVAGESVTVDRPEQIPPGAHARVWFLEHDGDPVVRNRPRLLVQRPDWLAPGVPRGRGVPPTMRWVPGITWLQVLVDTFFATNIRPGDFHSVGLDYRADLGALVAAAYRLQPDRAVAERLEAFLRASEEARA